EDSEVIVSQEINPVSNSTILKEKNNKLLRRVGMLQQRVIMLMSYTARERYEFFLKTYPTLPNRVSQKMIASYLGITPEALSKIRREMVIN
ncbi:MAG: Crp/Fnr family transcriptional regulator, partial [Bacteroidota bacterium]|nr:Crp/Fnr family transcriptional regulator [Bacteroidota bacterium]